MKNSGGMAKTQTTFSARKIEERSECKDRNCFRFWKMERASLIYLSELHRLQWESWIYLAVPPLSQEALKVANTKLGVMTGVCHPSP